MDSLKSLNPVSPELLRAATERTVPVKKDLEAPQAEKAAQEFEAILIKQMLDSMWSTVPTSQGLLSGSREEGLYRDMYSEALAKNLSETQTFGIRDIVLRELTKK